MINNFRRLFSKQTIFVFFVFISFRVVYSVDEVVTSQQKPLFSNLKWPSAFYIFDIDDNLFSLPTKIILFHKETNEEVPVSTREYAQIRKLIGNEGKWKNLEIRRDDLTGSFRYFRSNGTENYFLRDILWAIKNQNPSDWLGPSFKTFLSAITEEESAKKVYFLTARGHHPEEILQGIGVLLEIISAKTNIQFYLPPVENVFCIGGVPNLSLAKAEKLIEIIKRVNLFPIDSQAPKVLNAEGTKRELLHLIGFSDDDDFTLNNAQISLSPVLKNYPNVKFTLWDSSKMPITGRVIVPDLGTRPLFTEEYGEFVYDIKTLELTREILDPDSCQSNL